MENVLQNSGAKRRGHVLAAVALVVLLALSFANLSLFADRALADEIADQPTAQVERIEDDPTALGAFDEPHCWVHWLMAFGIVVTAGYGAVAISRRASHRRRIEEFETAVARQAIRDASLDAQSAAHFA